MSITKVGSSYNFIYNTKTGKLSTKDGSKNEFVDFCNGDVKGEDTETLNHFDEHTGFASTSAKPAIAAFPVSPDVAVRMTISFLTLFFFADVISK